MYKQGGVATKLTWAPLIFVSKFIFDIVQVLFQWNDLKFMNNVMFSETGKWFQNQSKITSSLMFFFINNIIQGRLLYFLFFGVYAMLSDCWDENQQLYLIHPTSAGCLPS